LGLSAADALKKVEAITKRITGWKYVHHKGGETWTPKIASHEPEMNWYDDDEGTLTLGAGFWDEPSGMVTGGHPSSNASMK
jgi:hypothetical protein